MAKAKRRRWTCPECGNGALGSPRPHADDLVRFCLPCSKKAGKLVRRFMPASKTREERRTAARRERRQRETVVEGVNWTALHREIAPHFGVQAKAVAGAKLSARRRQRVRTIGSDGERSELPVQSAGHATWTRRGGKRTYKIALTVGSNRLDAEVTLIHEAVHIALFAAGQDRGEASHGETFRVRLFGAVSAHYGIPRELLVEEWRWLRERNPGARTSSWLIHRAIYQAFPRWLESLVGDRAALRERYHADAVQLMGTAREPEDGKN